MGLPRLEVNLRRLIVKCELLIKNNQKDDPRFPKYISSLLEMCTNLDETTDSENKIDYLRRIKHLQTYFPQKVDPETPEIHLDSVDKQSISNRDELLGGEDNLRQRNVAKSNDSDELLDYHKNMQDKISKEMLILTKNLKDQSILASKIIKADTEVVTKSANVTDQNFSKLKGESEKLTEHTKRAWKCWMWVMLLIVMVLFISKYYFSRDNKDAVLHHS